MANKAEKFVNKVVAGLEPNKDPVYNAILAVEKKFGYDRYKAFADDPIPEFPPEYKRAINNIGDRKVYYDV